MDSGSFQSVLESIASRADYHDMTGHWPAADLDHLTSIGAMKWAIPTEFGGDGISPLELHERYEQIAAASLATGLILTQRDSAVQILAASENTKLRGELFPGFLDGSAFTTVGIAQLTTSRQRGAPAMVARKAGDCWRLDGIVPWCTGAAFASHVVVGAAVEGSSDQILVALPTKDVAGVHIDPPMPLVALRASHTTSFRCEGAMVCEFDVIRGPIPSVLAGRKHTLPAGQAFLALGLCRNAIALIRRHDSDLARVTGSQFDEEFVTARAGLLETCDPSSPPDPTLVARVRGQCNDLAVRVTHATVAIYKGSALLAGHPAQRLAREAMFLLVWSCPNPVIDCTVDLLSGAGGASTGQG